MPGAPVGGDRHRRERGDLTEIGPNPIGPIEIAIAEHVAELIPDGATLQIRYGSISDAIVQQLTHKHDLGVHTEMFGNGLLDRIESGTPIWRDRTTSCARSTDPSRST